MENSLEDHQTMRSGRHLQAITVWPVGQAGTRASRGLQNVPVGLHFRLFSFWEYKITCSTAFSPVSSMEKCPMLSTNVANLNTAWTRTTGSCQRSLRVTRPGGLEGSCWTSNKRGDSRFSLHFLRELNSFSLPLLLLIIIIKFCVIQHTG